MVKYYQVGDHIQRQDGEKITCTCMWMTMQMSKNNNFRNWKVCKHIRKILEDEGKQDKTAS